MGEEFALRVLPEKARADVDARKAVAVRGKTGDLLVGEARANRETFEALALFEELLEAPAVAWRDLDQVREIADRALEVLDLARRDLQRIGGIIGREHHAVAID